MPPEWAPHERTLMAWPCRTELWRSQLERARQDYATVANAIAAFEPVTMVVQPAQAAAARAACGGAVELLELEIDDSWLRDSGPIFVLDDDGSRIGVHFRFNAWGEKFAGFERDEAAGGVLAERFGDAVTRAPLVLEGGSIAVDASGTLLTTEQCLLNPNRNPSLDRERIEAALRAHLGAGRVVWLGDGLIEDRDTDGHVDLVAAFTPAGRLLLQAVPEDNPNFAGCEDNAARARAAGLDVVQLDLLPYVEVAGETVAVSYLNLYVCNGAVIVPLAGAPSDEEALARIAAQFEGREIVGVPGAVIAAGGGGPHCITQQVPARG